MNLAILAVVLELCVSANLLTWSGISYAREGGSLLVKLHPGTDILLIAFAGLAVRYGIWAVVTTDFALSLFLCSMAVNLVYLLMLSGMGNTVVLLDTFLPAGLLAVVLRYATTEHLYLLRRAMQIVLAASAVLAIAEMMTHVRLVPLYLNDKVYHPHAEEFRPTALFEHPLTGAVMTMFGLALCPRRGSVRVVYGALMWAALVAYGGRTALAISLLTAIAAWSVSAGEFALLRNGRAPGMLLAALVAVLVAVPLAGFALSAGLGTRIAGHLYWDDSAQVRLAQWRLLGELDNWQLVFGTRREDLLALLTPLRLGAGVEVIENFWLLMFVSLGLIGFPIFLVGFVALLAWCWQRTRMQGRLLLIGVILVTSTSNSLGRKSTILVCLVATIMCLPKRRSGQTVFRKWPDRGAKPVMARVSTA